MKKLILVALAIFCPSAFSTTTVSGNIRNLGTGNVTSTSGAFVRFWLRGCSGNQPRVNGTGLIGPSQGSVFYFDISADANGAVSGTLYSTRDAAGTGDGEVECGGSKTSTYYGMQAYNAGKGGPEMPIAAKNGVAIDISNVTPLSTLPIVVAPDGDTTYCRLDGGNGQCGTTINTFLLNGVSPTTEFQDVQGLGKDVTSAMQAGGVFDSGYTNYQENAISAFANCANTKNCVGTYSQGHATVNGAQAWGVNALAFDTAGLTTGVLLQGIEIDTQPQNASTAYTGVTGVISSLYTPQSGRFTDSHAFTVGAGQVGWWHIGYLSADGAAQNALYVGASTNGTSGGVNPGVTSDSQSIIFNSFTSGSSKNANIHSDNAGNLVLTPETGQATAFVGQVNVNSNGTATIGNNKNSHPVQIYSSVCSSASPCNEISDYWQIQNTPVGSGANPISVLSFTHSGSSSIYTNLQMPGISVAPSTSGATGIRIVAAANDHNPCIWLNDTTNAQMPFNVDCSGNVNSSGLGTFSRIITGSASSGGTVTHTGVSSGAGGAIIFTASTADIAKIGLVGQSASVTTSGVCAFNTAYNGAYTGTVASTTTYYIIPTGSETTGCGGTTNGSGTVSGNGTLPSVLYTGAATGQAGNTDFAGQCTLGTNCVITFTNTYATAPICVATDTTAANATKVVTSTTTLTITGTGTDVINYICVGRT